MPLKKVWNKPSTSSKVKQKIAINSNLHQIAIQEANTPQKFAESVTNKQVRKTKRLLLKEFNFPTFVSKIFVQPGLACKAIQTQPNSILKNISSTSEAAITELQQKLENSTQKSHFRTKHISRIKGSPYY